MLAVSSAVRHSEAVDFLQSSQLKGFQPKHKPEPCSPLTLFLFHLCQKSVLDSLGTRIR